MFSYSNDLFRMNDGNKIEFVILESSLDSAIVAKLIEHGGGSVKIKPNPTVNVLNLCCYSKPWMKNFEIFNTSYVYACCNANKKLSLLGYSMGKLFLENKCRELDEKYLYSGKVEVALDKCVQVEESLCQKFTHKDATFAVVKEVDHQSPRISSIYSWISNSQKDATRSPGKCIISEDAEERASDDKISLPTKSSRKNSYQSAKSNSKRDNNCPSLGGDHKESSLFEINIIESLLRKTEASDEEKSASFEIHPKDSASQFGRDSTSNNSSLARKLPETLQSEVGSVWEERVNIWLAETEEKD